MTDINTLLFQMCNGIAGRWWLLDSIVSYTLTNPLVKSAIITACFVGVWYSGVKCEEVIRIRRALMVALVAALLTLATTTLTSRLICQPRPYLRAHKILLLRDNHLEELPRMAVRQPLDNLSQQREDNYQLGNMPRDDFHSLPSDHAGLFVCLSLGICIASKRVGSFALAWTFLVIIACKVILGMHMPIEIAVSCLLAVFWLAVCWLFASTWFKELGSRIVVWTTHYNSLVAACLFLVLFEVASTFEHVLSVLAAAAKKFS